MTDEQRPKFTASEAKAALAKVRANMIDRKMYEKARDQLAEARAQIAVLREALEPATKELNAIRARDGAPQHIDWYRGQPLQTDSCTHEWWNELTEKCWAALDATPADCLKQIRAEVLEKAACMADQHKGSAGGVRRARGQLFRDLPDHAVQEIQAEERGEDIAADIIAREIRALKDKP